MEVDASKQSVSELMDGEQHVDDALREIGRLKSATALRDTWDTYHLIGDAMRTSAGSGRLDSRPGFSARFSERLALEPTVLAPRSSLSRKVQTYALSLAASVAAVAVVGWVALNMLAPSGPTGELAKAPAATSPVQVAVQAPNQVPAQSPASASVSSASSGTAMAVVPVAAEPAEPMHDYIMAHQGVSPTTAIQGVSPYIRTVSSTGE